MTNPFTEESSSRGFDSDDHSPRSSDSYLVNGNSSMNNKPINENNSMNENSMQEEDNIVNENGSNHGIQERKEIEEIRKQITDVTEQSNTCSGAYTAEDISCPSPTSPETDEFVEKETSVLLQGASVLLQEGNMNSDNDNFDKTVDSLECKLAKLDGVPLNKFQICDLCHRVFGSMEAYEYHVENSEMHAQNL